MKPAPGGTEGHRAGHAGDRRRLPTGVTTSPTSPWSPTTASPKTTRIIGKADGIKEVEYGYFKDVVISGTDRSMRIYSKPDAVSTYDVTEGRLPKRTGEIALDMKERDRFAVGSTLNVTEKTDIAGGTVLRHHKFTVVGFVRASETLSCLNMGQSAAGGGELKGLAVAVPGGSIPT